MKQQSNSYYFVMLMLFFSINLGCCFISKNKVNTGFHTFHIKTNVDSIIAQYYLENYLHNERNNPQFDLLINDLNISYPNLLPSRDDLREISKKTSVDFSALFFAHKLLSFKNNEK